MKTVQLLPLTLLAIIVNQGYSATDKSPILLVPGLTASQLEVDDQTNDPTIFCKTAGFTELWVNKVRLGWNILCAQRELTLRYDAENDTYSNNDGVTIRAKDFGGLEGVEYLTADKNPKTAYLHEMIEYFVNQHGYKRGRSIRAAPYDWRRAGDSLDKTNNYFSDVKELIEEMYHSNGDTPVTIVGHSMGGPVSHYLLAVYSGVDQEWKDQYIHAYITLAGAWSGGNAALQAIISGPPASDSFLGVGGIIENFFLDQALAPVIHGMESMYWMLPRESVWGDTPLVKTLTKTYTARDYEQLFKDLGLEESYKKLSQLLLHSPDFPAPRVPTHCYYGTNLDTPQEFKYFFDFLGAPPTGVGPYKVVTGLGDKTVNVESSRMCLPWKSQQKQPFESRTFPGVDHVDIVKNQQVFEDIAQIVYIP